MRRLTLLLAILLVACGDAERDLGDLTQRPDSGGQIARASASNTRLAVQVKLSHEDLAALLAEALPDEYADKGRKKNCRKVLGVKLCTTVKWDYQVRSLAAPSVETVDGTTRVSLPLELTGTVGLDGDLGKLTGLRKQPVAAKVALSVSPRLSLDKNWCPDIHTGLSHRWIEAPALTLPGGLDFDLSSALDKLIEKQQPLFDRKLKESIDCDQVRDSIREQWHRYSIPLTYDDRQMYLNLTPQQFALSSVSTEAASTGVTLVMESEAVVASDPQPEDTLLLPELRRVDYAPGETEFEIIVRVDYPILAEQLQQQLLNQTYRTESAAGDLEVTINAVGLYPTAQGIAVSLGFDGHAPPRNRAISGIVYLQATPVLDSDQQLLSLQDITLTRQIDDSLWNLLAGMFERRIIDTLARESRWDLAPRMASLKQQLQQQITDYSQQHGLEASFEGLDIRLTNLVPEPAALAVVVGIAARVSMVLPLSLLKPEAH